MNLDAITFKSQIWGNPAAEGPDAFFYAKFFTDERGELQVRPDWNFDKFIAMRTEGWRKTRSPEMQRMAA